MALIVAEIGTSHEGDIKKAKELVDLSKNARADVVKFQWVYADEILHPKTGFVDLPSGKISLYERFKSLECPKNFYEEMLNYSHEKDLKFMCSPFGEKSLSELVSIKPDFIKIASPELNHYQMLKSLNEYRKNCDVPVVVSSGVSTLGDIEKALNILRTNDSKGITLLHCVTSYPAPEIDYNLRVIENLSRIFGVSVGVSDHSLDPIIVPVLSLLCGSKIIEKHITMSKENDGLDDKVALNGEEFSLMCHCVRQAETALKHYGEAEGKKLILKQMQDGYGKDFVEKVLGDGVKRLADSEKQNYERTNRSLHFLRDIKKGETISKNDIAALRTEKTLSVGLSPEFFNEIVGMKLTKDVKSGDGVEWDDFKICL